MWTSEFWNRMESFRAATQRRRGGVPVSLKIRVTSGCFHREHSPHAYAVIDDAVRGVRKTQRSFEFVEHESGPEILVYVAAATAGLSLAKSVIDLVVAILKARSDGIRKGDRPADPLEVIIRSSVDQDRVDEELVLRVSHSEMITPIELTKSLSAAMKRLFGNKGSQTRRPANKASRAGAKAGKKRRSSAARG